MRVAVLIPYRGDPEGWRDRNFAAVLDQATTTADTLGATIHVGDSGDPVFSIARTWNQLASEAGPWDAAVFWGADFLLTDPVRSLTAALARVEAGAHYVFAFNTNTRCTRTHTDQIHAHGITGAAPYPLTPLPFGGVRAVSRQCWDSVGGYDPRFIGWGHEDRAHVHGVELLHGPRQRVQGHMLNLWHPKRGDEPRSDYFRRRHANRELLRGVKQIDTPDGWAAHLKER